MSGTEDEDAISVTERASTHTRGNAPADATVHTRAEADAMTPPPALRHASQPGHASGAILPNLRSVVRSPPEPARPSEPAWKALIAGPPLFGLAVFFSVLVGLPALACCLGSNQGQAPESQPTEVDGVPVRRGFK